jgi:hypothetical protein
MTNGMARAPIGTRPRDGLLKSGRHRRVIELCSRVQPMTPSPAAGPGAGSEQIEAAYSGARQDSQQTGRTLRLRGCPVSIVAVPRAEGLNWSSRAPSISRPVKRHTACRLRQLQCRWRSTGGAVRRDRNLAGRKRNGNAVAPDARVH